MSITLSHHGTEELTSIIPKTYAASLTYLKKMIPNAAFNIIYNRITYEEKFFEKCKFKDIDYVRMSLDSPQRQNPLFKVYSWLRDTLKLVEKKMVKRLYLLIYDKDRTNVLEYFRFDIKYNENPAPSKILDSSKYSEETKAFLKSFQALSKFEKLTMEDTALGVKIDVCDGVTRDQVPSNFEKFLTPFKETNADDFVKLGKVATGFHQLKVLVKGDIYYKSQHKEGDQSLKRPTIKESPSQPIKKKKHEVEAIDLDKIDMEDVVSKKTEGSLFNGGSVSFVLSEELEEMIFNDAINCLCEFKYDIRSLGIIKCQTCNNFEHLACLGFLGKTDISNETHKCFICKEKEGLDLEDPIMIKFKDQPQRQTNFKLLRLVLAYCEDAKNDPSNIYSKLPLADKKTLYKNLCSSKVYKKINGEYFLDQDFIKTGSLYKIYFYNGHKSSK